MIICLFIISNIIFAAHHHVDFNYPSNTTKPLTSLKSQHDTAILKHLILFTRSSCNYGSHV